MVRHLVAITNVAPEFAPPGRHLLSATVLDRRGLDDDALIRAVREDVHALFPGAPAAALDLEAVAVIDVPYALIRQGPGFARFATQAPVLTKWRNVWLAGDQVASGSINAAMETGERAAVRLLQGPM